MVQSFEGVLQELMYQRDGGDRLSVGGFLWRRASKRVHHHAKQSGDGDVKELLRSAMRRAGLKPPFNF